LIKTYIFENPNLNIPHYQNPNNLYDEKTPFWLTIIHPSLPSPLYYLPSCQPSSPLGKGFFLKKIKGTSLLLE